MAGSSHGHRLHGPDCEKQPEGPRGAFSETFGVECFSTSSFRCVIVHKFVTDHTGYDDNSGDFHQDTGAALVDSESARIWYHLLGNAMRNRSR